MVRRYEESPERDWLAKVHQPILEWLRDDEELNRVRRRGRPDRQFKRRLAWYGLVMAQAGCTSKDFGSSGRAID